MTSTSPPAAPTISTRLADHVTGLRFHDIPSPVVTKAKQQVAYLLGTALRGRALDGGQRAVRLARELSGAEAACSIVGESERASLLDAIFANSFLIASDGRDDFLLPHGAHPGIVVQPVAWAFGEKVHTSGRDLIAAVVAGYDVLATLCDPALTWQRETYRPATFVFEPFGATAAAARVLGLSRYQTATALGHAGLVSRHQTESGFAARTIHPLLARNGGLAAMLARSGMPARSTVIEGENGTYRTFYAEDVPDHVEASLAILGREFAITSTATKQSQDTARHPAWIPVELARRLLTEQVSDIERVAVVDVALPEERRLRETARDRALGEPDVDPATRRSSLSFQIAMVLSDGRIDPARLDRQPDADLLRALEKVRLRFEPDRPLLYARVDIATADGQRHSAVDDGETAPATSEDGIEWLTTGGRAVLPEAHLSRLVGLVDRLEAVSDVSDVMACVRPPATDAAPS
jgi:2-methylcitrate dehydratase PrpD